MKVLPKLPASFLAYYLYTADKEKIPATPLSFFVQLNHGLFSRMGLTAQLVFPSVFLSTYLILIQ